MPLGKSKCDRWVNNRFIAHLHGKMNPINLIWCESAQQLVLQAVNKVETAKKINKKKSCPWASQNVPDGHIMGPNPRRIQ